MPGRGGEGGTALPRAMTRAGERGVDTAQGRGHLSAHMLRSAAYFYFAFAGYFAPRTMGGCLDA